MREQFDGSGAPRSLARRLLWFVGLWLASVAVVGFVAFILRLWIA